MFEIWDDMNLGDVANGTKHIRISNILLQVKKVKAGAEVTMGVDENVMNDLLGYKSIPILVIVDRDEYFKNAKK